MTKSTTKPSPPRWAIRLLQWYCAPHLLEEVQGDLQEEFDYQVTHEGIRSARFDYIRNVIGFIRPFAIKRKLSPSSTSFLNMNMLKHYFIVANRNLIRHKVFSLINIIGLAFGMTCCLFIFLWIRDERSVDNFHTNGDHLYNVYETVNTNNVITGSYNTTVRFKENNVYVPVADIQESIPEVERITFYTAGYELPWGYPETFQVGEKIHKLEGSRAGKEFFTMFSYSIIAGDGTNALKDISSIAISRKMARMFFDSPENAIGKSMRYENKLDFVVTAVFEDVSVQSSLKFDFLINIDSHWQGRVEWASPRVLTTIQLKKDVDVQAVEAKINRFMQAHLDKNDARKVSIGLQPFRDQYLVANFAEGKPGGGRIEYVRIFNGVAVFILIIACINFMNLATARSIKRAKEIGVRKVVGSSRASLIRQFLGESMFLSALALIFSITLVHLLLPSFNTFTEKHIISPVGEPLFWILLLCLMLFTGIVAGSYPALFLSSLRPVRILKGALRFSNNAVWLRKGLTVFQFAISIVLLIVTLVISRQTSYVQNMHLGYDRENIFYLPIEGELKDPKNEPKNYRKYSVFKEKALSMPGIAAVDRSSEAPHVMSFIVDENDGHTETGNGDDAIQWEGKEKGASVGFKPMSVGFDFLKIMKLEVVEGRGFSKEVSTDSTDAFMINEEAVRQMGIKDPIGKWVSAWNKKGKIIGVLKDYHTHSLHEPIKPLILDVKEYEYFGVLLIRTEPGKTKEALASLEKVYKEVNPNYPLSYKFIDEDYGKLYSNEQVVSKLSNAFAILAIMISCLGLLGLVMFSAEQRTREFGIRKVLGATVANIVSLLSQDFLKLVFASFCIAAPFAGFFMYEWLQTFAYKINLSWWIFAFAGLTALAIALLTICAQAFKSAVANPVKALRSE
jgi:ABC-type antimicrobial peptide transport system permease subunit